jgi:acetylornithine deacetylase/succinyl-diaminopimelate desuccinylase-like protein
MLMGDRVRTPPAEVRRAWDRIQEDFESHLETIRSYLRRPSVSAEGIGIDNCAEATAELIEMAGGSAEVIATEGHPIVMGRIEGPGPRLLRYGMYDVQPADEPDWTSPPFEAAVRDLPGLGPCVVARGSANSKGCFAAFLCAVASAKKNGDLPVSLTFVVDGEEELGSPSLPGFFESHRDELACDAAFDLDLTADQAGVAWVTLGCKGIVSLRLTCRGGDWGGPPERALHSSSGVLVASPAWSLVKALSSLVDANEDPMVPGLTPPNVPPEDEPLVQALAERIDANDFMAETETRRLKSDADAKEVVRSLLYKPAININGLESGYIGGSKTIIPHEASAIVDIRVPYGLGLEEVAEAARDAIHDVAPEVSVEVFELCPASRTSSTSHVAKAMVASHTGMGAEPLVWPVAPWWAPLHLFEQELEVPFASGGAGHSGRAHAADEFATVAGLRQHMEQSVGFLWHYAAEFAENE